MSQESEDRVRLMLDCVPGFAILTLDPQGLIKTWNAGARDLFGYQDSEILDRHFEILFTPEDRAAGAPAAELRMARETGRAPDERWYVAKNGRRFYVSGVIAAAQLDGVLVGYTKVARDLTHREESDQNSRDLQERLEERVRERTGELAAANEALRHEIAQHIRSEAARVRLLGQVVNAQEEERRRISRELHDQLGQEITALGVKIAIVKVARELSPATRGELDDLSKMVKAIDDNVEFLVWELRPTGLDDLGLAEALRDYVASWAQYYGVEAHLVGDLAPRLAPETETVLYRIAQEALNNVARHARATRVTLDLGRKGDDVFLHIRDDGIGFVVAEAVGKRLGLVGMRERAGLVGGSTTIESTAREGTLVTVRVPG